MNGSTPLDDVLDRLIEAAEVEWSEFALERSLFKSTLLALLKGEADPGGAAATLHVGDLYLAFACSRGNPDAVRAFALRYLARVADYLRRFHLLISVDEVRSELEDRLLLGRDGAEPRIARYSGRGSLDRFVAAAARNVARTILRRNAKVAIQDLDEAESLPPTSGETFRAVASVRYRAVIADAVRTALLSLDRRQRMIVRLHLARGVTLTQIARMLKVHQSTISRALDGAVKQLQIGIRRQLRDVHGLNETEVASIIREVQGQVDVSLSRLLSDTRADR